MTVPSPSTVMPPPSAVSALLKQRAPTSARMRSAMRASSSNGRYLPPQALNVQADPASPSGPTRKLGPESRAQESSIGISMTSTPASSRARAAETSAGGASIFTGS